MTQHRAISASHKPYSADHMGDAKKIPSAKCLLEEAHLRIYMHLSHAEFDIHAFDDKLLQLRSCTPCLPCAFKGGTECCDQGLSAEAVEEKGKSITQFPSWTGTHVSPVTMMKLSNSLLYISL